ncbi:MAG: flagellar hook-associated protein FlgK, partial [Ramlibacter sp.]|nr:flagellar hook-associated protein FlgK [Ramlibacter sp.]
MTSSLLNIGSRALTAAQGSLATISHNIANANTVGYSRQEAVLQTSGGLSTGAGFFGRGVDLVTVKRAYDQFLTGSVQSSAAASAADNARASGLQGLDSLFADSANGIGAALDDLFGAAGDLANRPNDPSVRQVFIGRAKQLADRISTIGAQLHDMVRSADSQIAQDATQINGKLTQIAKLNQQIASAPPGQSPNDLLDQRDTALADLNKLISTHSVTNGDGSLSLFTTSGEPMLVGSQQARFDGAPDPGDSARTAVRMTIGSTTHWLDAPALGGGSLAGTLRFRDEDLASAINQVGRIALTVSDAVNTQQSLVIDMNGNAGAALFSVPQPVSIAGA